VLLFFGACRQDMHDQPKYKALRASPFFADGRASRPMVEGTVARGQLDDLAPSHTGKAVDGTFLAKVPVPVTKSLLARGHERFDIYCSVCHDRIGTGNGMVVQRGFRHPPSLHIDRLRAMPDGYVFDVITNGFGVMPPYAAQVPIDDRWAIVAYVRALQRSQNARPEDLPPEQRGGNQ
jgi:mono/diheme cytochrome c family protein